MPTLSKRRKANEALKPEGLQSPEEAVRILKTFKPTKFDQSVEVCMHLGIDPKQAEQQLRGSVSLPHGVGKTARVVAFCQPDKIEACKQNGAVEAGGEDVVEKIKGGWMEFDVAVASPDMMRLVSQLGKTLGPKGLMPSPKAGTVTPNVAQAVKEYAAGKVEYRNDDGGNIHCVIGKLSFDAPKLVDNFNHFYTVIEKSKPPTTKGQYVKKITISGTMTPGIQITPRAALQEVAS